MMRLRGVRFVICNFQPNTMQNIMEIAEFQGSNIIDIPELPGIYAWYYRPRAFGKGTKSVAKIMGKLIANPTGVKTEIAMRYGLIWSVDSDADVLHSAKRQPANKIVSDTVVDGGDLIKSFLLNFMAPYFTKPLYIGIDRKNLRQRIKNHYRRLTRLWDSDTQVSGYLSEHPDADIEEILGQLGLNHSFALNARVKGIAPRDLLVCVCPVETPSKLKDLERILQLIADPICGRR